MKSIEIKQVANGYYVMPAFDNSRMPTRGEDVHVFSTLTAAFRWIREQMEPKDEEPAK